MKINIFLSILGAVLILSCSDDNSPDNSDPNQSNNGNNGNSGQNTEWTISLNEVRDGGPGKDGIPALLNPPMIPVDEATFLSDSDLVIGLKHNNEVIAFPHKILDQHEIINVDIDPDLSIAITYCPLTGTGVGWDRNIGGKNTTFGVSGLLYRNNLIPYDRETNSNWSQLKLECVNGELINDKPTTTSLPEMKWSLWKLLYPDSKVIGTNTGYSKNYSQYPYGNYKTNNFYFIFPIQKLRTPIAPKDRVHAIIAEDRAKIYRFSDFESGKLINDEFAGKKVLVVGNQDFIVSFELDETNDMLDFTYSFEGSEVILTDNEGNQWNLFGEALSGPKKGSFLKYAETSMMAYYFSIDNFYSIFSIYN